MPSPLSSWRKERVQSRVALMSCPRVTRPDRRRKAFPKVDPTVAVGVECRDGAGRVTPSDSADVGHVHPGPRPVTHRVTSCWSRSARWSRCPTRSGRSPRRRWRPWSWPWVRRWRGRAPARAASVAAVVMPTPRTSWRARDRVDVRCDGRPARDEPGQGGGRLARQGLGRRRASRHMPVPIARSRTARRGSPVRRRPRPQRGGGCRG